MSASASGFYITGGTLHHDAPSYVERQADRDLFQGLRRGEFCYVLTSRQMGKSSLMVRTAARLREQGTLVVVLDLTAIGQNVTPEQWYDGLLVRMAGQLGLEDELDDFWAAHPRLSPVQRFFQALLQVVLPQRPGQLAIFVDEIDVVRSLKFSTDEFFVAIRECYNRRTETPAMSRVTFCLMGVAAPSDLIQDTRTTPFNVGRRIELNDFTAEEAGPLARGLAMMREGEGPALRALRRVLHWTNGHPYLTQRFCQALATRAVPAHGDAEVDAVCGELFLSNRARDQDDNLQFVRGRLLRSEVDQAGLLTLYAQVHRGRPRVADDAANPLAGVLRLSGIVRAGQGRLRVRNRIYGRVFDRRWIEANMPDAELRRQRAAFYRGVIRTTAIAAVVVAALSVTVWFALNRAAEARQALARSDYSQAQTRRLSGVAGQRSGSLEALNRARPYFTNVAMLRDEAIASLAMTDLKLERVRTNFPAGATAVAFSPDLAHYAIGDAQGAIQVRRTEDEHVTTRLPAAGVPVSWIGLSRGGRHAVAQYAGHGRTRFAVWDVQSGKALHDGPETVPASALDFSADGMKLAVRLAPGTIHVLSLPGGEPERILVLRQSIGTVREPNCVRFEPSGQRLAESALGTGLVQVWNLANTSSVPLYHRSEVTALAWSPDGRQLAASSQSDLYLWSLQSSRGRQLSQAHAEPVQDLVYHPDGNLLASLGLDRVLNLWCPATGRRVMESLDVEPSARLFFSPDGRRIGRAGLRSGLRIWQVQGAAEYRVFRAPAAVNSPITGVAFDPEGRVLFASSEVGAFVWDTANGRALPSLEVQSMHAVHAHPVRGDLLASTPRGLFRWPRQVLVTNAALEQHFAAPEALDLPSALGRSSLASEGKTALVVHEEHVHQFHLDSPSNTVKLPLQGAFKTLTLSPDGGWLATWNEVQDLVQVWAMQTTGETNPVAAFPGHRHPAFSPDSQFLLTSSSEGRQFWRVPTRTLSGVGLERSRDDNGPAAFGRLRPEGPVWLALADDRGDIRLFEFGSGNPPAPSLRLVARLESPDRRRVQALAFNTPCSRLAAVMGDQTVQVWDLARLQRELTALGLAEGFSAFPPVAEPPLTLTFSIAEPDRTHGELWLRIEGFDTQIATNSNPKTRASSLILRGKTFLDELRRPVEARADFEAALRLKPNDAAISNLLNRSAGLPAPQEVEP